MATATRATTARPHIHSTWNATLRTTLAAAAVVTLVLLAFAWPTYSAKVKDMPIAVVATDRQRATLQDRIERAGGAFEVRSVPDRQAAVDAIERREVYGGIVLPAGAPGGMEVLTATAGSGPATQMLTGLAQKAGAEQVQAAGNARMAAVQDAARLGAQAAAAQASATTLTQTAQALSLNPASAAQAVAMKQQAATASTTAAALARRAQAAQTALAAAPASHVTVTDVVPLSDKDPRGQGFAVAGLPLAMGGMIGGLLISTLLVGWKPRLVAVAGYAVLGGLLLALVLHGWFGFLQGSFGMAWLVCALAIGATAAFITGAQSLVGKPGIALGAIATMFVGNPLSSLAMPKEWLPGAWGEIGQWFVPGAAGTLLRNESYFPRADGSHAWIALLCWLLGGVALTLVGRHKYDEVVHMEGYTEPD